MISPPGEESNPYYKTQQKRSLDRNEDYNNGKWKNMTQKHIFDKEMLKISVVSPFSTKNCTAKQNKFSMTKASKKINPQLLELPEGLKDIGDSDIEPEELEDSDQLDAISVEEKTGIRYYQENTTNQKSHAESGYNYQRQKQITTDIDILENIDTVHNIENFKNEPLKSHRMVQVKTSKNLKEALGDYIDSSGGTIDAIDILDQNDCEPVEEITSTRELLSKNYSSVKQLDIGVRKKPSYSNLEDSSGEKAIKNKLKELTQLTGENCPKDTEIVYPLKPGQALRNFMKQLSDYEKGEILDFRKIWFLGLEAKKINGSPFKQYNYGYDDDKGDYKVVLKDHIGYRFEVIEPLGKGSFGQALR